MSRYALCVAADLVLGEPSDFDVEIKAAFPFTPDEAQANAVQPGLVYFTRIDIDGCVVRSGVTDAHLIEHPVPAEAFIGMGVRGLKRVRMAGRYSGAMWDPSRKGAPFKFVLLLTGTR